MDDHKDTVDATRSAVSKWEAQMRKGGLELAILAVLWGQARYGLEILRLLAQEDLHVTEGTVYPLLNRLRRESLVATEWVESSDGPPRKYYALTTSGRDRVRLMATSWHVFNRSLSSLLRPITKESDDD